MDEVEETESIEVFAFVFFFFHPLGARLFTSGLIFRTRNVSLHIVY